MNEFELEQNYYNYVRTLITNWMGDVERFNDMHTCARTMATTHICERRIFERENAFRAMSLPAQPYNLYRRAHEFMWTPSDV